MTNHFRNVLLGSGLLLLAGVAQAEPIRVSSLPEAKLPAAPAAATAPKSIPAQERVTGYYLGDPRTQSKSRVPANNYSYLAIFDDEAAADEYSKAAAGSPYYVEAALGYPVGSTCFTTATPNHGTAAPNDQQWAEQQSGFHYVYFGYPGVQALRAERWRETAQGASLETTVLWLDQQTGGMREVSRSTSELRRLATPYAGLAIYAARTETDAVELVVRREPSARPPELYMPRPANPPDAQDSLAMQRLQLTARIGMGIAQLQQLQAQMQRESRHSTCEYLRLRLKVRQQSPAPAALALEEPAEELSTSGEVIEMPEPSPSLPPPEPDSALITTSVVLGTERELTKQQATLLGFDAARRASQITGVRARALSIQAGISQLSRDAEPILSLSYRWSDKAKTVALFPSF